MSNIPNILNNPENPIFNLSESELYSIKEAKELIEIEKYSFSLFALWNCVVINIQRRIEQFGIKNFLHIYENKENYKVEGNNLKDRWLNVNEYDLISYAKKLNIIDHITHDLITTLYWMKTESNEKENKKLEKEEIYSLMFLLEQNLFNKEFKIDQRSNQNEIDRRETNRGGRRKVDREELISTTTFSSKTPSSTHQELLLKSGVKKFENNLESNTNDKNDKLLDAYI